VLIEHDRFWRKADIRLIGVNDRFAPKADIQAAIGAVIHDDRCARL
jgi:hypothetical protein